MMQPTITEAASIVGTLTPRPTWRMMLCPSPLAVGGPFGLEEFCLRWVLTGSHSIGAPAGASQAARWDGVDGVDEVDGMDEVDPFTPSPFTLHPFTPLPFHPFTLSPLCLYRLNGGCAPV